jgi:hypothetical protein
MFSYNANEKCPVTGLPVFTKPYWEDQVTPGLRLRFSLIGRSILRIETFGERTPDTQNPVQEMRQRVIAEAFPNHQPYVEIYDLSNVVGLPSSEVRRRHSSYHATKAFEDCKGVYIYGASLIMRSVYRIGLRLQGQVLTYPFWIVKDYTEAITRANMPFPESKSVYTAFTPLSLDEFEFSKTWQLVTTDKLGLVEIGIARHNIMLRAPL